MPDTLLYFPSVANLQKKSEPNEKACTMRENSSSNHSCCERLKENFFPMLVLLSTYCYPFIKVQFIVTFVFGIIIYSSSFMIIPISNCLVSVLQKGGLVLKSHEWKVNSHQSYSWKSTNQISCRSTRFHRQTVGSRPQLSS